MKSKGHVARSARLSNVQKGAIGQFQFLATALATGRGLVEAYAPVADNEGRDAEIRKHLKPAPAISIQVKVAFYTTMNSLTSRFLDIRFAILENRLVNDPRLWYFFAYYDMRELRLADPVFLIPAHVFHKLGRHGKRGNRIWFSMNANLALESHDRWSPYRVALKDLGKRLLEIIEDAPLTAGKEATKLPSDSIWIGRTRPRG